MPTAGDIVESWFERLAGEMLDADLPFNSRSNAYEAQRVVKSGRGTLFGLAGYNSKGSAQFIQVHDYEGVPADGNVPEFIISVAASGNFSVAYVIPGRSFLRGIYLCNSSTGPTKTIGSADCWFDAQFL